MKSGRFLEQCVLRSDSYYVQHIYISCMVDLVLLFVRPH